jgi:hypothetical protein
MALSRRRIFQPVSLNQGEHAGIIVWAFHASGLKENHKSLDLLSDLGKKFSADGITTLL